MHQVTPLRFVEAIVSRLFARENSTSRTPQHLHLVTLRLFRRPGSTRDHSPAGGAQSRSTRRDSLLGMGLCFLLRMGARVAGWRETAKLRSRPPLEDGIILRNAKDPMVCLRDRVVRLRSRRLQSPAAYDEFPSFQWTTFVDPPMPNYF
jgi:hypothetical protein